MFKRTLIASVYRPRRPRASPLWQIVHHAWDDFRSGYETAHRRTHGPLRRDAAAVVEQFYRCGDLAAGFTRLQCPGCGHEKLLAFICKTRGFCPGCHQRKVKQTGHWIAREVCFNVPHRQSVRCTLTRSKPGKSWRKGESMGSGYAAKPSRSLNLLHQACIQARETAPTSLY